MAVYRKKAPCTCCILPAQNQTADKVSNLDCEHSGALTLISPSGNLEKKWNWQSSEYWTCIYQVARKTTLCFVFCFWIFKVMCKSVNVCVCIYVYIHIYTYIFIHTYLRTYVLFLSMRCCLFRGLYAYGYLSTGTSLPVWQIAAITPDEVQGWHHYDDVIMSPAHLTGSNRNVPEDISVINEYLLVHCLVKL